MQTSTPSPSMANGSAPRNKLRLGDLLVQNKVINDEQLQQALGEQRKSGRKLGATLIAMNLVTEMQLLQFVVDAAGVGRISNKRASRPNHSHSFAYGVYNRQALQLIEQIYPHLLSYKAERCALVLTNYLRLTPRNGKYTVKLAEERSRF